jgi:hypothetical chaperone protein
MEERYGLDFGTSNSSIAIDDRGYIRVLPIDAGSPNPAVASSVLFMDSHGGSFFGSEAIKLFIEKNTGRQIVRRRVTSGKLIDTAYGKELVQFDADVDLPGRFFQAIKSSLPNPSFEGTDVFGSFFTIEQLAAEVLRHLKTRADEKLGRQVDSVVMGRPVFFSDLPKEDALAQERLEAAARLAGFKDIRFLYEPVGAALAYEEELRKEEIAFVFDFGGGTLDFSVIRLGPQHMRKAERKDDILAVGGLVVGGNTFDEEIMEKQLMKYFGANYSGATMTGVEIRLPNWILAHLRSWYTIPFLNERDTLRFLNELKTAATRGRRELSALLTLVEKNYGWNLFEEIERAKIALSQEFDAEIRFSKENIEIDEFLTRRRFEAIISGHLDAIDEGIQQTLKAAGVGAGDVEVVLRTGGSSLIPAVQKILENKFGPEKVQRQDVFTSVVRGLALAGSAV